MQKDKQIEAKDIKISQILLYFCQKLKPYKYIFLLSLLLYIVDEICTVYLPVYTSKIVDIIQVQGETMEILTGMLFNILWIFIGMSIIKYICNKLATWLSFKIEVSVMKDISNECCDYILHNSYRFFSNSFSGGLVRKISKLARSIEEIMDTFFETILDFCISLPLMIYIIMKDSVLVGFVFLGFGVIYAFVNARFSKVNRKYETISNERDSKLTGELSDSITNAFNILIFSSQQRETSRFNSTLKSRKVVTQTKRNRMVGFFLGMNIITLLFTGSCLGICFWLRGKGEIEASVILLVFLYNSRFTQILRGIERAFKSVNQTFGESAEMIAILNSPHEIQDKTKNKLNITKGAIEFQNVNFGYLKNDTVIDSLSLKIKPGEKVAIVGESGSGKTTLIKLLFRFFDLQKGKIFIDNQDISDVTQDSLRSQISMVPQDALLFHRSVKENIAYGKPNATDAEIQKAAKMARCHDFIEELPEGYDSLVGERGIKLSGGERQRIAIARAILENQKILILDEATSSLDSESEFMIQSAMDEVMKGKTVIVIAHRLSTIMKMDRIVVMDEGMIVEEGTHAELIKRKGGVYHKLWSIQSGGFIVSDEGDKMNFKSEEKTD